eukprot:9034231-Alexandrium_andersonii.AAC.1
MADAPNGDKARAGRQASMSHPGTTAVLAPHAQRDPRVSGGGSRPDCTRGEISATRACGGSPATQVDGPGPGAGVSRSGRGARSGHRSSGGALMTVQPQVCVSV